MEFIYLFYILIFVVAFLYASVGHGGASGYLALMALFSITPDLMKPTALLLNIFVSLISFLQFYRAKHFSWKIFLPFGLASVPMAFLGGSISIDAAVYKNLLGVVLLIPIGKILFMNQVSVLELKNPESKIAVPIGGAVGFLSGLIGIGGGIILSPVLVLLKWTDLKQAAAISALFIFVNSISGFAGLLTQGIHISADIYVYVAIAAAGGAWGSFFGANKFNHNILKYLLVFVLTIAAVKLLLT